jgi:hypothetical protein
MNFVDVADVQPLGVDEHGAAQPVLEQQVTVHTAHSKSLRRLCSLAESSCYTCSLTLPRSSPIRAEIETRREGINCELLPQRLVPSSNVQLLAATAQALKRYGIKALHDLQQCFI